MLRHLAWISLGAAIALVVPAAAADSQYLFAGDAYLAGENPTLAEPVARDAFLAGRTVLLRASVAGDAHMAGYDVSSDAAVTGSLYAAGYTVTSTAPIGGDFTAAGNTISLGTASSVAGNVRVAGGTITLAAPMAGSVLVTAQTLTLSGVIAGDLSFFGKGITFAPGARVDGTVTIRAPQPINVPQTVASADRVTFELADAPNYLTEAGKTANGTLSGLWPALWAMAAWLLLLFAAGAAAIALLPGAVASAQIHATAYPLRTFGRGILVFAATLGLVIVAALTVVGLFIVPILLIAIVLACSFAYVAGCYLIAVRMVTPVRAIDSNPKRMGVLILALVLATVIGLIPFLGWLITLTLVCFGFGAIAASRSSRGDGRTVGNSVPSGPVQPVIL